MMKLFMRFFFILSLVLIIIGLQMNSHAQTKGEPIIINFAYAAEKIQQGDIWKIYLSVTDPEGKMHRVFFRIEQRGGDDAYNSSFIYLKKGMEKEFTGYFALNTRVPKEVNELDYFVLDLSILDRAGNERKTLRFPVEFGAAQPMKPLPPEMEKDLNRRIGNINIDLSLAGV